MGAECRCIEGWYKSSMARCREDTEAIRYAHDQQLETGCEGRWIYLVLGAFGIQHGDEHVSVAVPFSFVRIEDVAQAGWW